MINSFEFATFLQNELDNITLSTYAKFNVRTPDLPYLDTINNEITDPEDVQLHSLPVMVTQTPEGQYSPVPELGMWDGAIEVDFIFPLAEMKTIELYYDELAIKLSGKIKTIGATSGSCLLAIGQRTFGQMANLDVGQFSAINAQINKLFGKATRITREWITMSFQVFANGASAFGGESANDNSIIMGNQVNCVLSFTNGTTTYTETLIRYDEGSSAREAMISSQQGLNEGQSKGVETSTAYGSSINSYVRNNEFWNTLLVAYKDNTINNLTFSYKEVLTLTNGTEIVLKNYDKANVQISLSYSYGIPLVCSLSLSEKESVVEI